MGAFSAVALGLALGRPGSAPDFLKTCITPQEPASAKARQAGKSSHIKQVQRGKWKKYERMQKHETRLNWFEAHEYRCLRGERAAQRKWQTITTAISWNSPSQALLHFHINNLYIPQRWKLIGRITITGTRRHKNHMRPLTVSPSAEKHLPIIFWTLCSIFSVGFSALSLLFLLPILLFVLSLQKTQLGSEQCEMPWKSLKHPNYLQQNSGRTRSQFLIPGGGGARTTTTLRRVVVV